MATSCDMTTTIQLIADFWPDLSFTKQDLVNGNPDFVVRFYSAFIAELNDKISYLISDEIPRDEFDDIQEFDERVVLFCKVARLFGKMDYMPKLRFDDFYRPKPKKMYPCLKSSIHFVIFLNNFLDEIFGLINEILKKFTHCESLKEQTEEYLRDCAEYAENVARLRDHLNSLSSQLEEVKKLHGVMMEEKKEEEKVLAQEFAELNVLRDESDNLEYTLKLLEDQEKELEESVITNEDYETLINTEKYLEVEMQRLCSEGTDNDNNTKTDNIKPMIESAEKFASLNLDALDVETLHDLRQQVALKKTTCDGLTEELNTINDTANAITKETETVKQTLEKTQRCIAELEAKIAAAEEEDAQCYKLESAKCCANFEERQRLESEIIIVQQESAKIAEHERELNETVTEEYQKILNMDNKVIEKFNKILLNMKNSGEDI